MKKARKLAAGLLCCGMLLSLLAGCSAKAVDPIKEVMGYGKDTVLFTVNDTKVTAEDYFLWLTQEIEYTSSYYAMMGGGSIDWEADMGGVTTKEQLKQQAKDTCTLIAAMTQKAKEEGFTYDEEDKKAYETQRQTAMEQQGGEEAYDLYLRSMCLTEKSMEEANKASVLFNKLSEGYFAEGGKYALDDAGLTKALDERKVLRAKHILLLTREPELDSKPYTQDKIDAQKKLAEDILAQLEASEDPVTLFDTLMNQYSEDTGLAGNPDGYVFSPEPDGTLFTSKMVTAFEEATQALEIGAISKIVESEYGYHIILRLDPKEDSAFMEQFKEVYQTQKLQEMAKEWTEQAEVKTTEKFDSLDVQEFYEKLLAYRETLKAEEPAGEDAQVPEEENPVEDGTTTQGGDGTNNDGQEDPSVTEEGAPEGDTAPPAPEGQQ